MPAQAGRYYWSKPLATDGCDNSLEIRLCVPIALGVKARDCDVKIGRKTLRVGLKAEESPIIDDILWKECNLEESTWEVDEDRGERCIVVTILKKAKWDVWGQLLRCEEEKKDTSITHRAFFEVSISGRAAGRIIVGLYGNLVPRTVENFCALCSGERGQGASGAPLQYKGTAFHRIVPDYVCQGGDVSHGDGSGGESVFGGRFADECLAMRHGKAGTLSMASGAPDANGSQFFITLRDHIQGLDGKHVVFGEVLEGFTDVVRRMARVGSPSGQPSKDVRVADCGVLP